MKRIFLFIALALLAAIAGCRHSLPSTIDPSLTDSKGIVFGRLVPLIEVEKGWAQFTREGGAAFQTEVSPHGFFLFKAKPGKCQLHKFGYQNTAGVHTVTLDAPYEFTITGGQVTYIRCG